MYMSTAGRIANTWKAEQEAETARLMRETAQVAFSPSMRDVFLKKGKPHRMKVRRLRHSLGLPTFATTEVTAVRYAIHDDMLVHHIWLTSHGQICVKTPVRFITRTACVLVPITEQHPDIPLSTAMRIARAVHR